MRLNALKYTIRQQIIAPPVKEAALDNPFPPGGETAAAVPEHRSRLMLEGSVIHLPIPLLPARHQVIRGELVSARRTVESMEEGFVQMGETRFLANIDAMLCRMALRAGDTSRAAERLWEKAPKDVPHPRRALAGDRPKNGRHLRFAGSGGLHSGFFVLSGAVSLIFFSQHTFPFYVSRSPGTRSSPGCSRRVPEMIRFKKLSMTFFFLCVKAQAMGRLFPKKSRQAGQ